MVYRGHAVLEYVLLVNFSESLKVNRTSKHLKHRTTIQQDIFQEISGTIASLLSPAVKSYVSFVKYSHVRIFMWNVGNLWKNAVVLTVFSYQDVIRDVPFLKY